MCNLSGRLPVKECKMTQLTENVFPRFSENMDNSKLMWFEKSRRNVLKTPIFDVNSIVRTCSDGRSGTFMEIKTPGWVNIVPVFTGTDGKTYFVMERQFRHGSRSVTLEFPAGLVEEGETPEDAALRELWEETGIKAGKLTRTGKVNPNCAFMATDGYFFVAEDLSYTGNRRLDANEQIEVVTVERSEVFDKLGSSCPDNGIMLMSAFLYLRYRGEV